MVINQMSSEANTNSSIEEMMQNGVDQAVEEGLSLCRGVVQRYIAYIQGVPAEKIFPEGVQATNEIGFIDKNKKQWFMKLDIVDDPFYKFPLDKCPGKVVRDTMEKVVRNLQLVFKMVLETEVDPTKVPRPELFMDSRLVITPLTSCFVYNEAHAKTLHDAFPKRIAFVWTAEGVDQVSSSSSSSSTTIQPNVAVPCPHPDDFLGPSGATEMPESDISALISLINHGKCRVCGGPAGCLCLA